MIDLRGHRPGLLRRLGFLRDGDLPGARGRRFAATRSTPVPDHTTVLEDGLFPILDQGQLGSCCGQAVAEAIYMRELAQGAAAAALGSRLWNYHAGRAKDGTVDADAGTTFRSVFTSLERLGFPPETAWPYSDEKTGGADGSPTDPFRREPTADAVRLAFDQRAVAGVVSWRSLDDLEGDLGDNVVRALASDYPVCLGIEVDEAFTAGDFDPLALLGPPSKPKGGHALVISGSDIITTRGLKARRFRVRNSYGADFGDKGYVYLDEEYVLGGDLWVVERVPMQGAVP